MNIFDKIEPLALVEKETRPTYDDQDEPAEKVAAREGLVVVYPAENELQLDLDSEGAFINFGRQFDRLARIEKGMVYRVRPSKSGLPRRHVTVGMGRPIASPEERILLQALLCSDPVRELLSFIRLRRGAKQPTRFFEKPGDVPALPEPVDF